MWGVLILLLDLLTWYLKLVYSIFWFTFASKLRNIPFCVSLPRLLLIVLSVSYFLTEKFFNLLPLAVIIRFWLEDHPFRVNYYFLRNVWGRILGDDGSKELWLLIYLSYSYGDYCMFSVMEELIWINLLTLLIAINKII